MRVLIFGAKGNLGQDLTRVFRSDGHEVVGLDREEVDVRDKAAIRKAVLEDEFDAVINAVAYNDVDGAEDPQNWDLVEMLNVAAPAEMAKAAREAGASFVHYSSDYVFEGNNREGYREDDLPRPVSAYGRSKLAGERAVLEAGDHSYVCRLSKIYGRPGSSPLSKPSFVSLMLRLAASHPELKIVDEEVGMPTYTFDIAEATLTLLTGAYDSGVYHLVNEGPGVTWYGFAEEIFGLTGAGVARRPVSSAEFPKPAKRPKYARLLNTKLPALRSRQEALMAFFRECPAEELAKA